MANAWRKKGEIRRHREKRNFWSFAALFLGLCFAQDICYVGRIGNLYVDVLYPAALVILMLRVVLNPAETERDIFVCFDRRMLPFLVVVALSLVLALVATVVRSGVQISSYANGLIILATSIAVYLTVLSLRAYISYILRGLWVGLLISVIVSIAQYFTFQNGGAFTFYSLFPQPAFYISVPWEASSSWASNADYLVFSYRAQGLYLECSYFVAAATMIYVVTGGKKAGSDLLRTIVLITLFVLFAMSATGNMVFFVAFILLAYILRRISGVGNVGILRRKRSPLEWIAMGAVLFLTISFSAYVLFENRDIGAFVDVDTITGGLKKGIESTDIAGGENEGRFLCMSNAIAEFLQSPWGVGYNMASSVLRVDYGTNTTFSYFLTLLVELGIPGLIAYGYFVVKLIINLLSHSSDCRAYRIGLAVSIMALTGFQAGNGSGLIPIAWCLFALAAIEVSRDCKGSGGRELGTEDGTKTHLGR